MAPSVAGEERALSRRRSAVRLPPVERAADPWRGVNLGGWLLLEPGPADPLFDMHPSPEDGEAARCEWDLMRLLRRKLGDVGAEAEIRRHREAHITKRDFERIRDFGLNAVRLPFGYWVALGPRAGDPYVGPALEVIDRALDWAEDCGLQVVLDLHGCPGGESGDAPCGRRQRPEGTWRWQQWDMDASLAALEVVCLRYRDRACVTGVQVCNEPSNTTPLEVLCGYYIRAAETIRHCGMPADRVAVVLPVFQRPEEEFAKAWEVLSGGRFRNYCFDTHCYHCFGGWFSGRTLAQQLRAVEANERMLGRYPMVVGEWSLALGPAAWMTRSAMTDAEVYQLFGRAQLAAYQKASHGHFFWNWSERRETLEWNFQEAFARGFLSHPLPALPAWSGRGEDPLEERLHPSPVAESRIFYGERIFLRSFYGNYVDVRGGAVKAGWCDKGAWQQITLRPGSAEVSSQAVREVRHGDAVFIQAHNGRYLSVGGGRVEAVAEPGPSARFVVHLGQGARILRHRCPIYFESKRHRAMIDTDEEQDGLFARFHDLGEWQRFAAEKAAPREPKARRGAVVSAPSPITPTRRTQPLLVDTPELKRQKAVVDGSAETQPCADLALPVKRRRTTGNAMPMPTLGEPVPLSPCSCASEATHVPSPMDLLGSPSSPTSESEGASPR